MGNIPLYKVEPIENLKEMLERSVTLFGDKTAFLWKPKGHDTYQSITYRQFYNDVQAFGTALMHLGLKDKRIALLSENRYEWAVAYLAVVNGTGIIVPLDRELPENEIESLLIRSKADAVIFSNYNAEQIKNISERSHDIQCFIHMDEGADGKHILSFHELLEGGREKIENGDDIFTSRQVDSNAMNILLFTSGTTEAAKAVMLSHKNICSNLMGMCSMVYIDEKDTFLSVLPLHHTYECSCGFLCQLYRGSAIAYCEGLRHIQKNIKESKTTVMLGVPLIFEAIYRRIWKQAAKDPKKLKKLKTGIRISNFLKKFNIDITRKLFRPIHDSFGGHLRLFISGAAAMDPEVAKGFQELGIHIIQGYGLTECAPIVAVNRDVYFKNDAAGLPLPEMEVRIDSPNEEGIGEIVAKGPNVMLGYYENPETTAQALKEGWFYTGDLGFIDSDGFVHITGRRKNVIVTRNGKNIYPEEIETLLNRIPYVKESMVFGLQNDHGDDVTVAAQIVPDYENIQEDFPNAELSKEEIYELIHKEVKNLNRQLVSYKRIKNVKLRDQEFAKTTTRKIKRYIEEEKIKKSME